MGHINVAVSFTDKTGVYCRHVGVLLASIFENTDEAVCVHIITDRTLTQENRNRFCRMVEGSKHRVCFYDIPSDYFDEVNLKQKRMTELLSQGALYRLFIPSLIQETRCIYLDVDIIVNMDISLLYNEKLDDMAVGAVLDSHVTRMSERKFCKKFGISTDEYFNSGVLLMNLDKIRELFCLREVCVKFLTENREIPHLDQGVLNYLFAGKTKNLPRIYNRLVAEEYDNFPCSDLRGIWHFAGPLDKPWDSITSDIDKLYWKYLLCSAWGNSRDMRVALELMPSDNFPFRRIIPNKLTKSKRDKCIALILMAIMKMIPKKLSRTRHQIVSYMYRNAKANICNT